MGVEGEEYICVCMSAGESDRAKLGQEFVGKGKGMIIRAHHPGFVFKNGGGISLIEVPDFGFDRALEPVNSFSFGVCLGYGFFGMQFF